MKISALSIILLATFFLMDISLTGDLRAYANEGGNCGCHPSKADKQFIHKPVREGNCYQCHKPTDQKHPRFKKEAFNLSDNGKAGLCYECHEKKNTLKFVHTPVAAGDCLKCHDAHQSGNKAQLKAPIDQFCYMCHEKAKYDRKYPHAPIAEGKCMGCHDPHQSNFKYMLKGDGMLLCFLCHKKAQFTGKTVHGPITKGDCSGCHSTHGTQYPHLLNKYFSEKFYMPFNKENFDLCFGCHNNQLADDQQTEAQTNFRNGLDNIHFIHVNKSEKGRSCKVCHDPHAAGQARLISDKIPNFGKWGIPIRFTKTNNGGTCVVGCHKPKSYNRINPVTNP